MGTHVRGKRFRMRIAKYSLATLLITQCHLVLAQESSRKPSQLPLPAHPERTPEDPEHTAPKAAQPDRESRKTQAVSTNRTGGQMPVPGRPGRRLEAPGEEESSSADGEATEEELSPGLFDRLPHSFRDGGWTWEYIYTGETFTKATGGKSPGPSHQLS